MADLPAAVRMRGIVKRFGDTLALDGVDFELAAGEIHGLLGENGAGKSTLMHILSGLHAPDAGSIEVRGRPARFRSVREAVAAGIGMVHQHFALVDAFTVAENLALASREPRGFLLPRRGLAAEALAVAERLGWRLDPGVPVWQLPVGVQQRIEIVKVLAGRPEILIFDEPTAVLAPIELEELFAVLRRLRAEGKAIVFISHKLGEVLRLCDRVTVLRRGRHAGTLAVPGTSAAELARRMVGEEAEVGALSGDTRPEPDGSPADLRPAGPPVLRLRNLRVRDERGVEAVRGISLEVRAGEVLGLAGVDGNGQAELAEAIVGLRRVEDGEIEIAGRADRRVPVRREIGYVPQDRRRMGLVPGMSVRENLVLELHQDPDARRGPWLRWSYLKARADEMIRAFDIRVADPDQPVETLSGGNQQKVVIARAIHKQPRLLVALNPTRGLDVAATAYVHRQLRAQRARGAAVLLISTELDEVLALSDRVGVLFEGRLMGVVPPDTPRETLGLMMGGKGSDEGAS